MKKYISVFAMVFASLAFAGCATTSQETCPAQAKKCFSKLDKKMFYKDGKFNQEAAKQAYFDMMEKCQCFIFPNFHMPGISMGRCGKPSGNIIYMSL